MRGAELEMLSAKISDLDARFDKLLEGLDAKHKATEAELTHLKEIAQEMGWAPKSVWG